MKSVGILCSFCLGAMMVACVSGETYEGETRIGWDDFEKVELTGRELFFDEEIMNPYHLAVPKEETIRLSISDMSPIPVSTPCPTWLPGWKL